MKHELIMMVIGIILISGCTGLEGIMNMFGISGVATKQETILQPQQGLGVTSFTIAVTDMLADTYNYVLMSVRNHAGGANAKNIMVSLENVKPFQLHECDYDRDASSIRTELCNQFYNDFGVPYKAHKINEMFPDEEVQFFWNIKAPDEGEIAKMKYNHIIYYTLSYDYAMVTTKTIAGISQDEFLRQSEEGPVTITGQQVSSAGEIKFTSTTQEPFIYLEGSGKTDINLNFEIENQGEGMATPETELIIIIKKPADTTINYNNEKITQFGWKNVSEMQSEHGNLSEIYTELASNTGDQLIRSISSDNLNSGKQTVSVPIKFDSSTFHEPQKILTFTVYITYNYLKEGQTTLSVYPIK